MSFAHFTLTNMPTTREGWEEINRMPKNDRMEYFRAHNVPPALSNALADIRPPIVITGDDGRFSIPSQKRWGLYIMPMDVFPPQGTLIVTKDGYEPLMVSVGWASTNLHEIKLVGTSGTRPFTAGALPFHPTLHPARDTN